MKRRAPRGEGEALRVARTVQTVARDMNRHTTGRRQMPAADRKAEAGRPRVETPSQVAADERAVS